MIYLITGTPGTGKTSLVVSMILNNKDGIFTMESEDGSKIPRPLYFCHIDGLDEQKLKAKKLTEEQIQAAPLNEIIPEGSILIVDEADYCYPTRAAAKEVPAYIKTLKELRHHGFTLILLTQHPNMLDSYIRNLIGKHWHLERKQIGTKLYEWNRCETNLNKSAFKDAVSEFYKPNKKAFSFYKSASVHMKFKKKLHPIFYGLAVSVVLVPLFFAKTLPDFLGKYYGNNEPQSETVSPAPDPVSPSPLPAASDSLGENAKLSDYEPVIANMPETKPIYNHLRQARHMEFPVGCVKTESRCRCYSSQGSIIYQIEQRMCLQYVEQGLPFNPYKDVQSVAASR